ncbi:MAG: hypothetical protein A2Y63_03225 [Candidatus Riflebacteria bacterium RBG_13_59_9]|nr:MAG: hypothetical protein A2Y63_03225 [Candidatus Riflebacteria bacterium RBG_13_59_9]
MFPPSQAVLLQMSGATAKIVALIMLVVFFVLAISVVPLEFRFYGEVRGRRLGTAIALGATIFIMVTVMLAGVLLDWYTTPRGLMVLLGLLPFFLILTLWFLYLRYQLIASLHVRAASRSREALELLLDRMKKAEQYSREQGAEEKEEGREPLANQTEKREEDD